MAFTEWLGSKATDTDLYLHPDGAGARFDTASLHVGYLQMWSEEQYRERVLVPLKGKWAALVQKASKPAVIVANFAAVHSLDGTCDGAYERLVRTVVGGFGSALPRRRVRLIFATAPCTLGLRNANFRTGKALETLSVLKRVASGPLPFNFTADVLDLTNITMARYDATYDGTHFYGSAIAAQALVLANMLGERPGGAATERGGA